MYWNAPLLGPITLAPNESINYRASYIVPPDFCGTDTVTASSLDACTFLPVVNSVTTTCPVIMTPRIVDTDEKVEIYKQVESSRMSWCLADILNMHGDVGLNGGNGLWGPAKGPVIYPDMEPTVIMDNTMGVPVETIPMSSVLENEYVPGSAPVGNAPALSPSAGNFRTNGPAIQSVGYQGNSSQSAPAQLSMPMLAPMQAPNAVRQQNAPVQQGSYK